MAKLIISTKDKKLQEVELKKSVTLGREVGEIMIKNPTVSAKHMKIEKKGGTYTVIDLGSTNGTFVNDSQITQKELKSGDIITVGKFNLVFENLDEVTPDNAGEFGFDDLGGRTMVMDTASIQAMLEQEGSSTKKNSAKEATPKLYLHGDSGSSKVITIEKETTLIGSSGSTDMRIKGITIGRIAATIVHVGDDYEVSYQGGIAKLKVNGSQADSHKLQNGDRFSIGSYDFEFRNGL